ncbi:RHS repeat domain-containing protein, partial [Duganella sp. Root336D2]
MGDVAKVIDPEGRQTVNTHDARRRLTSVTNALGQTTTYEYDGAG